MRTLSILAFALAAGCKAPEAATGTDGNAEIIGSFEQSDPNDPNSTWVGLEQIRVTTGDVECILDVDLDAVQVSTNDCASCKLSLAQVRSALIALDGDCEQVVTETLVAHPDANLAFEPQGSRTAGRVLVSEGDGDWSEYAGGVFDGQTLIYHRAIPTP